MEVMRSPSKATPFEPVMMTAGFGFWCTITGDRVKMWQGFQLKNIQPGQFNPNQHWSCHPMTQDARYEKTLNLYDHMEIRHCYNGTRQWNGKIDNYRRIPHTEIWEKV